MNWVSVVQLLTGLLTTILFLAQRHELRRNTARKTDGIPRGKLKTVNFVDFEVVVNIDDEEVGILKGEFTKPTPNKSRVYRCVYKNRVQQRTIRHSFNIVLPPGNINPVAELISLAMKKCSTTMGEIDS